MSVYHGEIVLFCLMFVCYCAIIKGDQCVSVGLYLTIVHRFKFEMKVKCNVLHGYINDLIKIHLLRSNYIEALLIKLFQYLQGKILSLISIFDHGILGMERSFFQSRTLCSTLSLRQLFVESQLE